ncbi:hypothetical protein GPK59_14035 [Dorea longicatena]|uniref:type III toxin-antitoxin system CptIN family toxin n=1 Tax=Dorea longicatena TaxID=88431 RepID=UPI001C031B3D|nr:hypothetical protein [Dorea longicatena]MBT9722550.1 hypothetical protein [Dorea longicatena]
MEIQQGYSYHIKDEFFDLVQDKYLMSNKEQGNYRPHYYAIQDRKNPKLYWMIPISSQAEKYKGIVEKYFDHVHTIQEQPVTIHKKLDKLLVENLNEVLAMYNRGIKLTFTDIKAIRNIMEEELGK